MDDSVKKFRARRDARLKKRMDDDWITIKGTHVMVDEDKNITAGPERLKNAKKGGSGSGDIKAEYERIPLVFALGGSKYATPEEKKQRKETIDRFMSEAKDGDVYSVGGASGGGKFKVSSRGGKLQLQWERSSGYSKPVIMSRSNVEKYIRNGAKLVSRK